MSVKLFMIALLTVLFSVRASVYHGGGRVERNLQLQAAWWAIQDPEFAYYSGEFIFRWRVSDYIQDQMASIRVYDGWKCKEGSNDITDVVSDFARGNLWLQNLGVQPDANTPYNPDQETTGDGFRDFRLFLDVQPDVSEAPFFKYDTVDNQNTATMKFCIRFQLWNDDPGAPDAIEVNFQETLVEFTVDLTDGFKIENFNASPKEKTARTANFACEIIGYECDWDNKPIENPGYLRNQGAETRICVELSEESKKEGLYLDRIHWFYFIREDPRGDVKQNCIIWDSQEAVDSLTEYRCMRGVEKCPFNVILRADFYQWDGVGIVRGIGEGLCQYGGGFWLVEDVPRLVGEFVGWVHQEPARGSVQSFKATGFPVGVKIAYTDVDGTEVSTLVEDPKDFELLIAFDDDEGRIRQVLDTLTMTAPLHSDVDFELDILVVTTGGYEHRYHHPVTVYAVADPPQVTAADFVQVVEDGDPVPFEINPDRSADEDGSEYLSVKIHVPKDELGPIGSIVEVAGISNVKFSRLGADAFEVAVTTSSEADPATRENILDQYLRNGVAFKPRAHWSGHFAGTSGLKIEAVSTEQSDQIATANSIVHGTVGDMDCKVESAFDYVDITVDPVNDPPYLENDSTTVQENKLNSDVDVDLVIPIGQRMNLKVDDVDGSQTLNATISGFPLNLIDLSVGVEKNGVTLVVDSAKGTVAASGKDVVDVLAVLNSIEITLAHDDDRNFLLQIGGTSTDTNGVVTVSEDFYLTHQVIVQAVADTPTLNIGARTKSAVSEDTKESPSYPVAIALNDQDGSETYQQDTVTIKYWTATDIAKGEDPTIEFATLTGVALSRSSGQLSLTGSAASIETVLASMKIKPGAHNGEDIYVEVDVTAAESNPSEQGDNEIAKEQVTVVETFVIPITPTIQGVPTLIVPSTSAQGAEDTIIPMGTFQVNFVGIVDPDGSEVYYLEIDLSSFGEKTFFWVNGILQSGTHLDGWLRLPGSTNNLNSQLSIQPPPNFSGAIELSVRGIVVDSSTTGVVSKTTDPQLFQVQVFPRADDINRPTGTTTGIEDQGPINFGNRLVQTGMTPKDDGTGPGNNPETETITQVEVILPQDTATMTYQISYELRGDSITVLFDESTRTYSIVSSIITEAADLGALALGDRQAAQTQIRDTLNFFSVTIGPEHNSDDGKLQIKVKTLDVNLGAFHEEEVSFNHTLRVQAVADTPGISVHAAPSAIAEDSGSVSLHVAVTRSDDEDNSETLSVRITVPKDPTEPVGSIIGTTPSNVKVVVEQAGVYLITSTAGTPSERQDALNAFLADGDMAFKPRDNWAGSTTLKVDAISTESATGGQLAAAKYGGEDGTSKTETVTAYIVILVNPIADVPQVKVASNAAGLEDMNIKVPIRVTLTDADGSETYVMEITDDLPAGTKLFGANGTAISASGGVYTIKPTDMDDLYIKAPKDWSSALPSQGDIVLRTKTIVTDQVKGLTTSTVEKFLDVPVRVLGVADKPASRSVQVTANEDLDYMIGPAIGSLEGVLKDVDGSETLYIVLAGLPGNAVAKTDDSNTGISYLGSGEYFVEASAIPNLKISPRKNYAGDKPYPELRLRAVAQELEGDQISSDDWPIDILVWPVVDGIDWDPMDTAEERQNEEDNRGILLRSAGNYTYRDDDGSEEVVELYLDFSNLVADAQIAGRLQDLLGASSLSAMKDAGYIVGDFEMDGTGKVTVQPKDIAGLKLHAEMFLDSNVDFDFGVSALVRETVTIKGEVVVEESIDAATFSVHLKGTADVPTVVVDSIQGNGKIPISLGGESTDTDVALGRSQSESIYYIVRLVNGGKDLPGYAFINGANHPVGFAGGQNTWILSEQDVQNADGDLFWTTRNQAVVVRHRNLRGNTTTSTAISNETIGVPSNVPRDVQSQTPTFEPATFELTSCAVENDGDNATNTAAFTVQFWFGEQGIGADSEPPKEPNLIIGTNDGTEDALLPLDITVTPAPGETTDPTVSVVFHNLRGATVEGEGLIYNFVTKQYVARADSVNGGGIQILPPLHFSGSLEITIEVIAVSSYHISATTGQVNVPLYFDPVADELSIELRNTEGVENVEVPLPITVKLVDDDGSEKIKDHVYVKVCDKGTLSNNYTLVSGAEAQINETIDATSYHKVPIEEVGSLSMQPMQFWHGSCNVSVIAIATEKNDDQDGDNMRATKQDFVVTIAAVTTPPVVAGPSIIAGLEDTFISIEGLRAELTDTIFDNGGEVLSVTMSGVPNGTLFNYGANSGTGTWSIPVDKLSKLEIKGPLDYAGTFTLIFTAISKELTAGVEESVSLKIPVQIAPVADDFIILVKNQALVRGTTAPMQTNLRDMDTRGNEPGELPAEKVYLTFSGVPTGVDLSTSSGGLIKSTGAGNWLFTGTQAQANSIQIATAANAPLGVATVSVSGYTVDGNSTLESPIVDDFVLEVKAPANVRNLDEYNEQARSLQNTPELHNCGSAVKVEKDNPEFPLPLDMFRIDSQNYVTIDYRLKHVFVPTSNKVVQWIGILHPEAPVGLSQCPTNVYKYDEQISIQGNCKDNLSRVYVYLNIEGDDGGVSPSTQCKLPEGAATGGATYVYIIALPCASCTPPSNERKLLGESAEEVRSMGNSPGGFVVQRDYNLYDDLLHHQWINKNNHINPTTFGSGEKMQGIQYHRRSKYSQRGLQTSTIGPNDGVGATAQFELEVSIQGNETAKRSGGVMTMIPNMGTWISAAVAVWVLVA